MFMPKRKKIFPRIPPWIGVGLLFGAMVLLLCFPMTRGLILLPLDLLVSSYRPWSASGTILLKNSYMQDSVVQMFPWKHLVFEAIRRGVIPFWNPYQFGGMPFLAGLKPMVFYPLTLLGLLGDAAGWNLLLVAQLLMSLWFTYLFARSVGLSRGGSVVAGIAFAWSSLMIGVLEFGSEGHAILWLPIMLWACKLYIETKRPWFLPILGGSVALSIFAGQLQYTGYLLLLVLGFLLFWGYKAHARWSTYFFLLVSIGLGIGLAAVQLGPGIEMFRLSERGLGAAGEVFSRGLIPPYKLFRYFSPDFFGHPGSRDLTIGYIETSGYFGIVPLFFALIALCFGRKNPLVRFFGVVFVGSMLLSLKGVGEIIGVLRIPAITSGSGDRIAVVTLFSGALLAGFGLDHVISQKNYRQLLVAWAWFLGAFFLAIVFSYAFAPILDIASRATLIRGVKFSGIILVLFGLGIGVLAGLGRYKRMKGSLWLLALVIILTYGDLFRMAYRFLTFSNPKFLYEATPAVQFVKQETRGSLDRVYGLTEPEIATALGVYTSETYNPLYSRRHATLVNTLLGKRHDALNGNKYTFFGTNNGFLKYALDVLGTKYLVIEQTRNLSDAYFGTDQFSARFEKVYDDGAVTVHKSRDAYPRFGLYYSARVVGSDAEALDLLERHDLDLTKTVIVEEDVGLPAQAGLSGTAGNGTVKLINSTVNTLAFDVTSSQPGLLYLSDSFYPGWHATVDGVETKIYRANYDFRAVRVPAGLSKVIFWYEPTGFRWWIGISAASAVALLVLGFFAKTVDRRSLSGTKTFGRL